jgi:hypothetical protein
MLKINKRKDEVNYCSNAMEFGDGQVDGRW